ncbi:MAG: hypothetical protein KKI15_02770 [Proteobacteria bacterium]|nr:hypothetical protein [Pseudomonadota bacterium]
MSNQTVFQIKANLQTTKAVLELKKAFHSTDQIQARFHVAAGRFHKAKARQILSSISPPLRNTQ